MKKDLFHDYILFYWMDYSIHSVLSVCGLYMPFGLVYRLLLRIDYLGYRFFQLKN